MEMGGREVVMVECRKNCSSPVVIPIGVRAIFGNDESHKQTCGCSVQVETVSATFVLCINSFVARTLVLAAHRHATTPNARPGVENELMAAAKEGKITNRVPCGK